MRLRIAIEGLVRALSLKVALLPFLLLSACSPPEDDYGITVFQASEVRKAHTYAGGGVRFGSNGQGFSMVSMLGGGREGPWVTTGQQWRSEGGTVVSLQAGNQVCGAQCLRRGRLFLPRYFADIWAPLDDDYTLSAYVARSRADGSSSSRWRLVIGQDAVRYAPEVLVNNDRRGAGGAVLWRTGVLGVDVDASAGVLQARGDGRGFYVGLTLLRSFVIEGDRTAADTPE